MQRKVRLNDELVVLDPLYPQLISDVEQVLLVLHVEDDGVGSIRDIVVGRTFSSGVRNLRCLLSDREVGADHDVVIEGTPRSQKGGK